MDKNIESLKALINSDYEYDIDALTAIYKCILESESQVSSLRYFFEHMNVLGKSVNSDDEESVRQFSTYYEKYNKLINGIIARLVKLNVDEDSFYLKLWNIIENGDLVDNDVTDKIYAWLFVWRNNFIPYFQLANGIKMSNEDYQSISERLFLKISEINFIFNTNFDQKTEQCSLLLTVLDSCKEPEEKSVLLSQLLGISNNHARDEGFYQLKKILRKADGES